MHFKVQNGDIFGDAKRSSCMVWEINMGVCPRLDFYNIILFNCLGYNFNIYGAFEFFYAIPLLIYDVMNDITIIPYVRIYTIDDSCTLAAAI